MNFAEDPYLNTFIVRLTDQNIDFGDAGVGTFTRPVNGEGGEVKGIEISYNHPWKFLPGFLSGLGVYANYTYIESDIELEPAFVEGTFPLPGLSKNSYNLVLWYAKYNFEWRVAYRYRDAYSTELGEVPDQVLTADGEGVFDARISYDFDHSSALSGLKLLIQASNLTDEPFQTFYGDSARRGRYEVFGRSYWLGFSYSL